MKAGCVVYCDYYDVMILSAVGCQLAGYRLSSVMPQDQQWGVISIDKVSLVSAHISSPLCRSSMQVCSSFLS